MTADEALVALQNLTIDTGIGTRYYDGLNQADQFLLNSRYNPFFTTGIGYFFTDGQNSGDRLDMLLKARDVRELANFQAIGYYSDLDTLSSDSLKIRDVNWIDSNQGVFLDDISDLPTELLKSDLADDVVGVNILLDGEIVDTITPNQLTDSPLGLTYEGSVEGLDVSIDAENIITAEVVFTPESNLATTNVDYTVTAGEEEATDSDGNPIAQSGNEDPFENILEGSDNDDTIRSGYIDRGINGGAGNDRIVGNELDNLLDGGVGNDTILAHGGDDTIITGEGRDRADGGEGIDTVVYDDKLYGDSFIRKVGNIVSVDSTDSLTDVEFIRYSDFRISTETLAVTPILEVDQEEISVSEGDEGNTTALFTFNLSTPAPVDVQFTYNTIDGDAVAGADYIATSGQATIAAGETSTTVAVEILGDTEEESNEVLALNLSEISGATFANNEVEAAVVVNIENDDLPEQPNNPPTLETELPDLTATEDQPFQFTIPQTTFDDIDPEDSLTYTATLADGSQLPSWLNFNPNTRTFSGTPRDADVATLSLLVTATDNAGASVSDTFNLQVSELPEPPSAIRTNAGGNAYTDALGQQWLKSRGFVGGRSYSTSSAIAQTEDDVLYQSEVWGNNLTYTALVQNGVYELTLSLAEIYFDEAGQRVFDVTLEDQLVLDELDLFAEAGGKNIALDKTFRVEVTDSSLDLSLTASVNNAKVSALEIELIEPSLHPEIWVNAGGNAYTDALGQQWLKSRGFVGGRSYSTSSAIAQTEDDALYQSEVWGNEFDYTALVASGIYEVTLKFAEIYLNQAGQRVFDVTLEDQLVLDEFDIFAEAGGKNIALDKTFRVEVTDGTLDLGFAASVSSAKVSAIEIQPSSLDANNATPLDFAEEGSVVI